MLKMRLQRIGRRNDASYRLIVTDSRRGPKSGKHIDLLGSYNPKLNQFAVDEARAREWIGKGVQVSGTVHNLLVTEKVIEGKKINVLPRKTPIVSKKAEGETTPEAPKEQAGDAKTKAKEDDVAAEATSVATEAPPTASESKKTEKEAAVDASEDTFADTSSESEEEKKAA